MLAKQMMITQFEYNDWANGRFLDHAAQLSPEQFTTSQEYGHGSLHQLLFHTLQTEVIWRTLCQEQPLNPATLPQVEDLPDVAALRVRWQEEVEQMNTFLISLSEENLAAIVPARRPDGSATSFIMWHMLQHRLNHSMQHRSEAAAILTRYGQSPGNIDFVFFVMAQG